MRNSRGEVIKHGKVMFVRCRNSDECSRVVVVRLHDKFLKNCCTVFDLKTEELYSCHPGNLHNK